MCLPGMDGKEEVCKSQLRGPSRSEVWSSLQRVQMRSSRTIGCPGGRKRARRRVQVTHYPTLLGPGRCEGRSALDKHVASSSEPSAPLISAEWVSFLFWLPQPGSDSGTTAVVALIRGKQLIVANAGDSRCVVSERGGPTASAPTVTSPAARF